MDIANNSSKQFFLPLGSISSDNEFSKKILMGLGKSTKRGIKRCCRCGVYNGTRSSMCKNKECGIFLKESSEKSKVDLDAVKLVTGTEKQVYSVRVRDMGPDYRGFVQLPLLQIHSEDELNILTEVALCFVNSCQNSFDNSILKCHEEEHSINKLLCAHIKSAIKSQSTACPMELKKDVLQSLSIADNIKEQLFLLASEKEGVLVQRVSKAIMAVKCQVDPKHPLGYLHFTFVRGKGKDMYEKYYCSCTEFIVSCAIRDRSITNKSKCLHYYACIWAIASDSEHCEEFLYFIQNAEISSGKPRVSKDIKKKLPLVSYDSPKLSTKISVASTAKRKTKSIRKPKMKPILKNCKTILPKILPVEIKVLNNDVSGTNSNISWNFIDWLTYVTESINKTMQFENCGIINTLIFQIPEQFYKCLTQRIPRLYEVSKIGDVTIYNIMNILHVKEILDTPKMKLKISKKFIHLEQKGYVEDDENVENDNNYQCSFIFFLNVGQTTVDESDNTNNSFVIEWMPSVTSLTNIGQLKLQYKFGRKGT